MNISKIIKSVFAAFVCTAAITVSAIPASAMEGSCELNFNYYSQSTWAKTSSDTMTLSETGTYTLKVSGLEEDPELVGSIFLKDAAEMPSGLSNISVNVDSFKVNGTEIALANTTWDILDGTCFEVTLVNAWADSFADISGCGTINDMEITFTVSDYGDSSSGAEDTNTTETKSSEPSADENTAASETTAAETPESDNMTESAKTGNVPAAMFAVVSVLALTAACISRKRK